MLLLVLCWICFQFKTLSVCLFQTITEKHKLNVPETMTEVLDVSDEEGESFTRLAPLSCSHTGAVGCRGCGGQHHVFTFVHRRADSILNPEEENLRKG